MPSQKVVLAALAATAAVVVAAAFWLNPPTEPTPPMTLVAEDAAGDATLAAADIVGLGAAHDATTISIFLTVADATPPAGAPVTYRAGFAVGGARYDVTASCLAGAPCDAQVSGNATGRASAEWLGRTLRLAVPRALLPGLADGLPVSGLAAATSRDGKALDATTAGSYRVADRSRPLSSSLPEPDLGGIDRPPAFVPLGDRTVAENAVLAFTVEAADPDGDAVTLSAAELPAGAAFDAATGRFAWTPGCRSHGAYTLRFDAPPASQEVRVTVTDVDCPPVLRPVGDRKVAEDALLTFTLNATDPEGGPLAFGATGLPAGATLNAATGAFSWRPTCRQHGAFKVTFAASDGNGTARQEATITVADADCAPALRVGNKTVAENSPLRFRVDASDGDGSAVTRRALDLPTGASFNAATGNFTWTPTCQQHGTYRVAFTATAGGRTTRQNVTLTVTDVDCAPTLSRIGNKTVAEGTLLAFTVQANDPDGGAVTRSATGLPAGATFDGATGRFSWRPGCTQAGRHTVTFAASDAARTVRERVNVTVTSVDCAPVFAALPDRNATVGTPVSFTVSATDPEGRPVTLSVGGLPAGATFDVTSGAFSWTPAAGQAGRHTVTFTATDGAVSVSEPVVLTVS